MGTSELNDLGYGTADYELCMRRIERRSWRKRTRRDLCKYSSPSYDLVKIGPILFQFLLHIKPSHQKMSTISSQSICSALTVISANIEGLSSVKASMLSDLCKKQYCHRTSSRDIWKRYFHQRRSEGKEHFCHCSQPC